MIYVWIHDDTIAAVENKADIPKDISEILELENYSLSDVKYLKIKDGKIVDIRQDSELQQQYIERLKQQRLRELSAYATRYIHSYYPDIKQKSDIADKEFYTTMLVNKLGLDVNEIAKTVYNSSARILEGSSTLEDEVSQLSKDDQGNEIMIDWNGQQISVAIPWEQLIKVGVRTGWVQLVKNSYRSYVSQIEQLDSLNDLETLKIEELASFPIFPSI